MPAKKKPAKVNPKHAKPTKAPAFESQLLKEMAETLTAMKESSAAPGKKEIPKGTFDPDSLEIFHQKGEGSYWMKEVNETTGRVEYVKYKPSRLVAHFKYLGMTEAIYNRGLREIDWPIYKADRWNRVDYCGALAGHRAGKFTDKGGRVFLVTDEAQSVWAPILKEYVRPTFLNSFTLELLQSKGEWEHAMHWMAKALASLIRGDFRPGPALGLAGEAECGKTLFQYIITQLFGGRSGKPWKYMVGEEKHNYDLVTSEHLVIGDPPTSTDTRTRRFFGNMIKEVCFEEEFRIRAMTKDALAARLWHRLSIAVNDEDENLMVFPPLDASLRDKISLLKCHKVTEAFNAFDVKEKQAALALDGAGRALDTGDQDRGAIQRTIDEEMPHFRAQLLAEWVNVPNEFDRSKVGVDPQMRSRRTGICAYQNPELLEKLTSLSPEVTLLGFVDQVLFDSDPETARSEWTGRAFELEKKLRESEIGMHADRLLSRFPNACGTYLGRAAKHYPERISREVRGGGVPYWTITPPQLDEPKKEQ